MSDCCNKCGSITLFKGTNGDYVQVTPEPAGVNCPEGGLKVEIISGVDDTTVKDTQYVCNGEQGLQGDPGLPGNNGADGVGISNIAWTSNSGGQPQGTQGTTDTYTITLTDASTYNFLVTNGADGAGGGGLSPLPTGATEVYRDILADITGNFSVTVPAGVTLVSSGLTTCYMSAIGRRVVIDFIAFAQVTSGGSTSYTGPNFFIGLNSLPELANGIEWFVQNSVEMTDADNPIWYDNQTSQVIPNGGYHTCEASITNAIPPATFGISIPSDIQIIGGLLNDTITVRGQITMVARP